MFYTFTGAVLTTVLPVYRQRSRGAAGCASLGVGAAESKKRERGRWTRGGGLVPAFQEELGPKGGGPSPLCLPPSLRSTQL